MLRGHRLQKFSRVVDDEPAGQPLDLRLEFRQLAPVELDVGVPAERVHADRKSTRLNSSHITSSYAVFCLKKKKHEDIIYAPLILHRGLEKALPSARHDSCWPMKLRDFRSPVLCTTRTVGFLSSRALLLHT